jgi:hypothetical protein
MTSLRSPILFDIADAFTVSFQKPSCADSCSSSEISLAFLPRSKTTSQV